VQIHCPECKQLIQADQINLERGLAKCQGCHNLFRLDAQIADLAPAGPAGYGPTYANPAPVPIPAEINLQRDGGTLVLSWRWFNVGFLFLAFFCLFWDGFLVFWYSIGFAGGMPLVALLFPLLHVAVGVGLSWYTLGGFLNHTVIKASREELSVKHLPLWMPGMQRIPTSELSQLFCRERVVRGRNGPSVHYELCALLRSGKEVKLVQQSRPEQARYLEQQIESHLGIQNRPVGGEMP
jgi:hypothetical protein